MLQYIINTSAIWLLSLVMFDLFLRRESYHNYNRFYLMFTFLLGALFPLIQFQGGSRILPATLDEPVGRVITAKENVIDAAGYFTNFNWQAWLTYIYLAGATIAMFLLFAEVYKLISYYSSGKASHQQGWKIIETGKEHAPFSFRNTLFVCSIEQYNPEEWQMILTHEKRHADLLHFADLLVIQLARIVFWFHPLVYLYNNRLLMVHEYQADRASAVQPQHYGRFLVEQALLQSAPSISHSFNRSPIKNRITMLTRRSSVASRTKMLVFIPLALVCLVCFSKTTFSQRFKKNGNIVTYRGNKIELSEFSLDTMTLVDPVTGKEIMKVMQRDPAPIKMNGKKIADPSDESPAFTGSEKDLRNYLLLNMRHELGKLDNGSYRLDISNIVIDEHGKIAYFDFHEMKRSKTYEEIKNLPIKPASNITNASDPKINVTINEGPQAGTTTTLVRNTDDAFYAPVKKEMQEEIFNKICRLMETAPAFRPGVEGGKKAITIYHLTNFWNNFKVENHKLYDVNNKGEYVEL